MGNPANTEIRTGWEDEGPGIRSKTLDGYHRLGAGGELLADTWDGVPVAEIDGTSVDQGDEPTTVATGPKAINMRLRADLGSMRYLARFLRGGATVTTPAGATLAREHIWDQNQTSIAFDKTLTIDVDRDSGLIWSHRGCDVGEIVLDFQGGELANMQATVLWRHTSAFDDKVVVSDLTPNTEQPELSGLLNQTNFDLGIGAGANQVFVKVDDITNIAASPPNVQVLAKVGAGAYGTNDFTLFGGLKSSGEPRLAKVIDSVTGQPVGTCRIPTYLKCSDLTDFEVIGTPDEWSWVQALGWTPTLGTAPVFNNACATIIVDGEEETLNSCTLTMTRNFQLPGGGSWIGSGFPVEFSEAGRVRYQLEFAKDQLDTEVIEKIIFGKSFAASITLATDVFIDAATQYDHRLVLDIAGIKAAAGSEIKTTTAEDDREETFTGVASGTPPVRATLWTPITDFAV